VAKGEWVESIGTHERRLRKIRNRSLLLPLFYLFDEKMWPCQERDGVPLCKLIPPLHKRMKEPRFLLALQSLRLLRHHNHRKWEVSQIELNLLLLHLPLHFLLHHSHQRWEVDQSQPYDFSLLHLRQRVALVLVPNQG